MSNLLTDVLELLLPLLLLAELLGSWQVLSPDGRAAESVSAMRRVLFLRSPETGVGTMPNSFKFPESSYGRGAQAVHLCPVEVTALARVASFSSQLLDSP